MATMVMICISLVCIAVQCIHEAAMSGVLTASCNTVAQTYALQHCIYLLVLPAA